LIFIGVPRPVVLLSQHQRLSDTLSHSTTCAETSQNHRNSWKQLARYMIRPPFALSQMTYDGIDKLNAQPNQFYQISLITQQRISKT
jgi:hypothetical protein